MTHTSLDDTVLTMFCNEKKSLLSTLVAVAVGKGEHPLVGLRNISGRYHLDVITQEKALADNLKHLDTPESLAKVKSYLATHIAQFQKRSPQSLIQGSVPFFLYAMYLAESLEGHYDEQTAALLQGVMNQTILEKVCPILAEELPPGLTAIFHHHIYDRKRKPSNHETQYNVPSYVIATCCGENTSTLYRVVDKGIIEIGTISHSQSIKNLLVLRRKPLMECHEDNGFLITTARSDHYLTCMGIYRLEGDHLVQVYQPQFFTEPISRAWGFVSLREPACNGPLLAFAIDDHYRATVIARMPSSHLGLNTEKHISMSV